MVTDALLEADAAWGRRLSNAIASPAEYQHLTDYVLQEVEGAARRGDPGLAKAGSILHNLRTRRLYRFCDEYLVPVEMEETVSDADGDALPLRG